MASTICFNLDQSKILASGNRLTLYPTDNVVVLSKFKAFADKILNFVKTVKLVFDGLGNIVEICKNVG